MRPSLERAPDSTANLLDVLVGSLAGAEEDSNPVSAPQVPSPLSIGGGRRPARQGRRSGRAVGPRAEHASATVLGASVDSATSGGIRVPPGKRPEPPPGQKPAWGSSAGPPVRMVYHKEYLPVHRGGAGVGAGGSASAARGPREDGSRWRASAEQRTAPGLEDRGKLRNDSLGAWQAQAAAPLEVANTSERREANVEWSSTESKFTDTMKLLKEELAMDESANAESKDNREDSAEHYGGRTPSQLAPRPLFVPSNGRGQTTMPRNPVPGGLISSDVSEVSVTEGWNERLRHSPSLIPEESSSISEVVEGPQAATPVFYKHFSESRRASGWEQSETEARAVGTSRSSSRNSSRRGKSTTWANRDRDTLMETPKAAVPVFYKNFAESMSKGESGHIHNITSYSTELGAKRPVSGQSGELPSGSPRSSVDGDGEGLPLETHSATNPVFYTNFPESAKATEEVEAVVRSNGASSSSDVSPVAHLGFTSPISDSAKDLENRALGMGKTSSKVGGMLTVKEAELMEPARPIFYPEGRRSRRGSNTEVGDGASSSYGGTSTGEARPKMVTRVASQGLGSQPAQDGRPESKGKQSLRSVEDDAVEFSSVAKSPRWSGGSVRDQIELRKQQRASLDDVRPLQPGSSDTSLEHQSNQPRLESERPGSASVAAISESPVFFTSAAEWQKTRTGSARSVESSGPTMVLVRSKSRRNSEVKEYVNVNSKGQTVYAARNGLNLEWVKPSLEEAERVRKEKQAHHAQHSVWGASPNDMHAFGAGVGLFFWISKWLIALMFFLTIISLPTMIIYGSSNYAASTSWPITINLASLGDFGPIWDNSVTVALTSANPPSDLNMQAQAELHLRDAWWLAGEPGFRGSIKQRIVIATMDKSSMLMFASSVDFVASVIIGCVGLWLFLRLRRTERMLDDKTWTISDYTVMVTGLPDYLVAADLGEHFGSWGRVSKVELVHDDAWFYRGLEERGAVVEMAEREVGAAVIQAGDGYIEEMFLQLCMHIKESSEELLETVKVRQDDLSAVAAFVTFESAAKMEEVVEAYSPYNGPLANLFMPSSLQFRGASVKVTRAPEPTNVQYENLAVSIDQRRLRSAASWSWLILVLLVSFLLMSVIISVKVDLAEDSLPSVGVQYLLLVAGVVLILLTNLLLWAVTLWSARREAHPTFSQQRVAATVKLYLALFLSSGILAPAANVLLPFVGRSSLSSVLLGGIFPDFTPRWYHDVGLMLILAVLFHAVLVLCHLLTLAHISTSRRKHAQKAIIQCDMNRMVEGPDWDLRFRLALHLNILTVVIIFGSALPLLYAAGLVYFIAAYFADKAALLRVCRLPPLYGSAGMRLVPMAVGAACLARLGVAAWAFSFLHAGSSSLSPSSPNSASNLFARLFDTAALAHSLTFIIIVTLLLAALVMRMFWATCRALFGLSSFTQLLWRDRSPAHDALATSVRNAEALKAQPTFGELVSRGELIGPDSYCLRNSVWYAAWHVEALLIASLQLYVGHPGLAGFMQRVKERHDAAITARKMATKIASEDGVMGARYLMQPGCESAKLPPRTAMEAKGGGFGFSALLGVFMGIDENAFDGNRC